MKRREFIASAGAAAAWPLAARAQQVKLPTVGVLLTGDPYAGVFLMGFRESLKESGYIDGQSIRLEVRSGGGNAALLPEMAAELVRLKVDVIVTSLTPTAQAAKQATIDIPIVMAPAGDPVATGLVASLARPGGNVTGLSAVSAEIVGKSLDLIREVLPSTRRVALLANEVDPFTRPFLEQVGSAARALGLGSEPVMTRPGAPLEAAFEAMTSKRVDSLIVQAAFCARKSSVSRLSIDCRRSAATGRLPGREG